MGMTENAHDALVTRIAQIIDHPSVYMGGPSRNSLRIATEIVKHHRADLCASGQQVRALEVDDLAQIIRVVDGNNTLGAGELAEAILEAMPVPRIVGALTPAPQAATPTAQEAVPTCFACEDSPKPPNIPCAVCGAHPATPAPGIAEAVPVAIRHSFDGNGWLYADQGSGSDWQKRFSQYPDAEVLYDHPAAPAPRIADRLRHELTINPNLTFADAIEWVEYLANGGSDA